MASGAELSAKIGVLLSNNTEVIQILLRQLSVPELSRVQRVCKLWQMLVAKELTNRQQLLFFTTTGLTLHEIRQGVKYEKEEFMRWKQHWQSKPSFCLQFHDLISPQAFTSGVNESLKRHLPPTCQVVEVPSSGGLIGTKQMVPTWCSTVRISPSVCQSSACPNVLPPAAGCRSPDSEDGNGAEENGMLMQACPASSEATPPPCKRTRTRAASKGRLPEGDNGVPTAGVACTSRRRTRSGRPHAGRDPEMELPEGAGGECGVCRQVIRANVGATSAYLPGLVWNYTCSRRDRLAVLCLPQLPGVAYLPLSVESSSSGTRTDGGCLSNWDGCIPPSHRPKAILVFNDDHTDPQPYIREMLVREEGRVAVAGGLLSNAYSLPRDTGTRGLLRNEYSPPRDTGTGVCGVAVCGDGVVAASVVLTEDIHTEEEVVKALKQLEQLYDPRKRSVAFFVTCIGRTAGEMEHMPDWETSVFRKLFPATPVVGCFVYGETCYSHVPYRRGSQEWEQQEQRWRRSLTTTKLHLDYAYSTVVLFLQFG